MEGSDTNNNVTVSNVIKFGLLCHIVVSGTVVTHTNDLPTTKAV